ncbi:FAD/NAD(P)-binding protein [Kitasatospora aureofaciens]|uniref:FAD/NAD(P)-binding protein n=1 Tax=Kitasatospora aureofaciens TaxID=1894 RepID=UPI001C456866|nr:FAD/NAD(P)-binding protein [Kitasatospora aureofaciens]MBV6698102.1 FAD/NAD(P)-binding protein [Kitasatospora aureofaciens]
MSRGFSIGIVGGGAAAVCLIDALAGAQGGPGSITVFEPSPHLWRGRAYQPDTETLRVNATPDDMSVRAADPGHFERWLETHDRIAGTTNGLDRWSGVRFAPRTVYGDYLEQSACTALADLRRQGWQVNLIGESVEAAVRTADEVVLRSGRGNVRPFDYVALCVGGDSPEDTYGLSGAPGFTADPYPILGTLQEIDADDHIGVIGSGLTSVDIILSLAGRGHRGRISLLSRSGVLPGVRQRPVPFELRHFTPERMGLLWRQQRELSIEELGAIMTDEFREVGADLRAVMSELLQEGREDPVDVLRRQFADVDSPHMGLRILRRAVPETGPDVWPLLRAQDKAEVLRAHYRTVMSLCCPMPPSSAAVLLELFGTGQLQSHSGLRTVAPRPGGGFDVVTERAAFTTDRVINAVNAASGRIPAAAKPLVTSLVDGNAARQHPHGGLHLARATSRLTVDGTPDPRLYGLGNIGSGSLFFTWGLPSLVDRSVDIAAAILAHASGLDATRTEEVLVST